MLLKRRAATSLDPSSVLSDQNSWQLRCSQYGLFGFMIIVLAVILRCWGLEWKPPHFDEGINGWFADQIRKKGFYTYDPTNYHGPLYFYFLFFIQTLFGRHLWALRLPAVISSLGTVWLTLRFDRFLNQGATLLAALVLTVSPAAVFYGRYSIHESSVVFSLMLVLLGLLGLSKIGDKHFLWITMTGVTLLLLLKETAVIHLGCFIFAAVVLLFWQKKPCFIIPQQWNRRDFIKALLLSIGALFFFYSGTLFNCKGFLHVFNAIPAWIHTGMRPGGHGKTEYQFGWFNFYWLALMIRYEWPSLIGFFYALWLLIKKEVTISLRYLSLYSLGVLAAYSLIPYKTPWCLISIIFPFALLFGVAAQEALNKYDLRIKKFIASLIIFVFLASLVFCLRLNFWHYVDFSEPYVYVQTSPEIRRATNPLLALAKKDPRNLQLRGQIFLESYYPLPWILDDFTSISYYTPKNPPNKWNGDFIFVEASLSPQLEQQLEEPYYKVPFQLRNEMEPYIAFFKKKSFHSYFEQQGFSE